MKLIRNPRPNEQRKVDALLARLAKMKPNRERKKVAPLSVARSA